MLVYVNVARGPAGAGMSVKEIICLSTAAVRDSSAWCRAHSCQIISVRCQSGTDKLSPTVLLRLDVIYLQSWSLKWMRVVAEETRSASEVKIRSRTEFMIKTRGNKALYLAAIFTASFMHAQAVWNDQVVHISACVWEPRPKVA